MFKLNNLYLGLIIVASASVLSTHAHAGGCMGVDRESKPLAPQSEASTEPMQTCEPKEISAPFSRIRMDEVTIEKALNLSGRGSLPHPYTKMTYERARANGQIFLAFKTDWFNLYDCWQIDQDGYIDFNTSPVRGAAWGGSVESSGFGYHVKDVVVDFDPNLQATIEGVVQAIFPDRIVVLKVTHQGNEMLPNNGVIQTHRGRLLMLKSEVASIGDAGGLTKDPSLTIEQVTLPPTPTTAETLQSGNIIFLSGSEFKRNQRIAILKTVGKINPDQKAMRLIGCHLDEENGSFFSGESDVMNQIIQVRNISLSVDQIDLGKDKGILKRGVAVNGKDSQIGDPRVGNVFMIFMNSKLLVKWHHIGLDYFDVVDAESVEINN